VIFSTSDIVTVTIETLAVACMLVENEAKHILKRHSHVTSVNFSNSPLGSYFLLFQSISMCCILIPLNAEN